MFELLNNCDGVCAGNWTHKQKEEMGLAHKMSLAQHLFAGFKPGALHHLSARAKAAKEVEAADDAMV